MKGDFSWFDHRPLDNFTGVLEQQGRVRLDRDGNAADAIGRYLRTLVGRDTFGPGRVAVPAELSDSLRISAAATDGTSVSVTLRPGRVWVDGIPLHIGSAIDVEATYLPPPLQPQTGPQDIQAGTRDAVVLEVWEDSVSAFAEPVGLLEPALGGVDTTARVRVCYRLRLRRLAADQDCMTIRPSLQDDPAAIGRLTVTPAPAIAIAGDCPVEAGGGYSGDGHRLYCIEVAAPRGGGPRFVWSRLGGGLLGRGRYDSLAERVAITHNRAMLDAARVDGMLLQALGRDPASGCWRVAFEATATLGDDGIDLTDPAGSWPAAPGEQAVFRLWDGVGEIGDFVGGADLADGIRLDFAPLAAGGGNYREGDRWLFQARAAGTEFDPSEWPHNAPPQAPRYHRAALGILNWSGAPPVALGPQAIDDCRDSFPPLTDPQPCCTLTVGDGRSTHGDTDSIEAAIERLPASGGHICLLPGLHQTNAVIRQRANIRVAGCGKHSRVVPRPGSRDLPIFRVIDSECIELVDMEMIAIGGVGVLAEEVEDGALRQLTVRGNRMVACIRAVQVEGGSEVVVRDNRIRMLDRAGAGVAVYLAASDSRIEDNDIGVLPADATPVPPDDSPRPEDTPDPNDPCADQEVIYADIGFLVGFVEFVFGFTLTAVVPPPYRALGGVQVGAGSERVAVLDNRITGGAGNGVTLGGSHLAEADPDEDAGPLLQRVRLGRSVLRIGGTLVGPDGRPAEGVVLQMTPPDGNPRSFTSGAGGQFAIDGSGQGGTHQFAPVSAGIGVDAAEVVDTVDFGNGSMVILRIRLNRQATGPDPRLAFVYAIRIEDNRITGMGLNGIGIPPALGVLGGEPEPGRGVGAPNDRLTAAASAPRFSNARAAAVNPMLALLGHPALDLTILNNRITGNLRTPFSAAMRDAARVSGLGGISLGLVETLTIAGNLVEDNGRRHIDPVCGVFVLYGEQVEITDNLIRDNGRFVEVDDPVVAGMRGGVVGAFASVGIDDFGAADNRGSLTVKPALRVHDNVVQHPQGRTLTLLTAGPVSIVANHLTAERTGPEALDLLAGAVMAIGLSGIGGLPSGGYLLQANQITLGPDSSAFSAVALAAGQDLGIDANQVDALQRGLPVGSQALMMNTLVFARSIRATGNRFREQRRPPGTALQVSLVALSTEMNVTSSNQGDHCLFAFDQSSPPRLVNAGNLVFDDALCRPLRSAAVGVARNPVLGTANLASLEFVGGLAPPDGEGRTYASGLDQTLAGLNAHRDERLAAAVEYKTANAALLANEVARLEARPLVRTDILNANRARLNTIGRDLERLRSAGEITATRPVAPADDGGQVIQGRVTDSNGKGLLQAAVQLSDERGNRVDAVDPVRTDSNGSYLLALDRGLRAELAERLGRGATLVATLEGARVEPLRSALFRLEQQAVLVEDIRFTLPADARPIVPGGDQRTPDPLGERELVRPVLTTADARGAASGRIAPLLRGAVKRKPAGDAQ